MRLFIEPTEPLLFRTGRPFSAGENNFAETLFPPTPETIQGAVRAAIATHWNPRKSLAENFADPNLVELIGIYDNYGRFHITSFSLGRYARGQAIDTAVRLFPAPSHILYDEEKKRQIRLMPEQRGIGVQTNLPDNYWLLSIKNPGDENNGGKLEPLKGWLTEKGLQTALLTTSDITDDDLVNDNAIFTRESRLGIGMNNRAKTTEEGMLYQVQMIRMNHILGSDHIYGFIVDVGLDDIADSEVQGKLSLPNEGWITLGGERRAAYFKVINQAASDAGKSAPKHQTTGNLLYLATPAALYGGWQPASWPTEHQPITAAITHYQSIGGWQLKPGSYKNGENKVMRRCVPIGSVYFFNETITNPQHLTDYGSQIGYGITYTGEWK